MEKTINKLKTHLNSMDWSDVLDILENIDEDNVHNIIPILPNLLQHKEWTVRAETVDIVGGCGLEKFLKTVKAMLYDKNRHVRAYALAALYDLKKEKAIKYLETFAKDRNVTMKINALALLYIAKGSPETLNEIRKIVLRKNCNYFHQFNVISQFDYYLEIKKHPEIIELYKDILKIKAPSSGVAKQLKGILRKMK